MEIRYILLPNQPGTDFFRRLTLRVQYFIKGNFLWELVMAREAWHDGVAKSQTGLSDSPALN